jgi:glycosyltransferase involved in cell wall biosynthesis
MDQFDLTGDQVRVVSDAVSGEFVRPSGVAATRHILSAHGIAPGDRFILYVGGISPHKNIETLPDAFCGLMATDAFRDLKLVLVGDAQGDVFFSSFPSLRERINTRGVASQVIFTGFVPDADLPHWYSAARTLVMPSVDEGFGLPALESMACGTPVVVSRAGALPEVVGDAGLLFDPRSTAALQDALTRVLSDTPLHESLAARGLQRATQFTWRASARSAIETFSDVHGRRP